MLKIHVAHLVVTLAPLIAGCDCGPPVGWIRPCDPPPNVRTSMSVLDCGSHQCGGNSPAINYFPINGIDRLGRCNKDSTQQLRRSLHGSDGSCDGATLWIVGNELVGLGRESCTSIVDKSFIVRSHAATLEIKIAERKPLPDGHVSYRLETTIPKDSDTVDLCSWKGSKAVRDHLKLESFDDVGKLGAADLDSTAEPAKGKYGGWVIPVVDELRTLRGQPFTDAGNQWLHFACLEDALAKRTLLGYFQPPSETTVAANRSALEMLTANYCGDQPLTKRNLVIGMPKEWLVAPNDEPCKVPSEDSTREAAWGPSSALCLDQPRLLAAGIPVANLPRYLLPPDCQGDTKCDQTGWLAAARKCKSGTTIPPCDKTVSCARRTFIEAQPPP